MKKPKVTVIGSINMDLLTSSNRLPAKGETTLGNSFSVKPGGKGANQAIAAARLGAEVYIIGKVANDEFGEKLVNNLKSENVNTSAIDICKNGHTGIANVILHQNDNRIIIVPGVNDHVTNEYVIKWKEILLQSDIVLMQMEIPIETIIFTADFCCRNDIPFIINPAPAKELPDLTWFQSSYITPNENEKNQLFGENPQSYKDKLIVTLGEKGVLYKNKIIPSYPNSNVVDTTGAGDTFNGAFAYNIASGLNVEEAIYRSNIAASLAIEKLGAQEGMPYKEQVLKRLKSPSI